MHPEDTFLLNDPYTGGTHLPDIAIVQPIIAHGRLIAFSAAMTHHQDMGGMSAGSVPTNATEIYQEGLRLPPLKLRDAGVMNETLVRDHPAERAHSRHGDGRHQRAAGRLPDRRAARRRTGGAKSATTR